MSTNVTAVTLTFMPTTGSHTVRWESPVLGVRMSSFVPPYRGDDLSLVLWALDRVQRSNDPLPRTEADRQRLSVSPAVQARLTALDLCDAAGQMRADVPQRVGRALWQALCADAHGAQALGTVRDHATATDTPLTLRLCFPPDAVDLAALPWELLWDAGPVPLLLSRGRLAACTRHLDLAQALPPPRPSGGPLRMLAVVPQAALPAGDRDAERQARLQAWQPLLATGQVIMNEVTPATRTALVDAVQRQPPDLLHYYGHARYANGAGALLLDAPDGGIQWTGVDRLIAVVGGIRLVVLHICQTTLDVSGTDEPNLLTGIAPALSAAGIPLVIGMQMALHTTAATRTSGIMYRALAGGASIQDAVSQARQALYVEEADRVAWAVPTLSIRSRDTGPAYLIQPPSLAPSFAATPATPPVTSQVIVARKKSMVRDVALQGGPGSDQFVRAVGQSAVERAKLQARHATTQHISAEDASAVTDVTLDDQRADPE